ncbi:MAG TPA: hypothetical protein VKF62_00675 [Planctomycetota bacterium]|nr:hypothetical protein [Planctomycetota bacterium]
MAQFRRDRGAILVILLASVALLAGAIVGLLSIENARAQRTRTEVERARAFLIAESGIDTAAALLSANAWPAGTTLDWSADVVDNDGDGLVDEGDETLLATADLWGTDDLDNDGDGQIDEADERVARVDCEASIGISKERVVGWLRKLDVGLPINVPAALTILDPNADVNFAGNSFRVNGNDTNLNGTPGPSSPVYGIAIDGATSLVTSQLGQNQRDNVTGVGGWPSITTWSPGTPGWLQGIVDLMEPLAHNHFVNYPSVYSGSLGNAAAGDYLITHSQGTLRVGGTGGSSGAGVLCVEGDLEISGSFSYVGYVFVTGKIRMTGGGSGSDIRGAVFVGGDVQQSNTTGGGAFDASIAGSIDLLYSSEGLANVRAALGRYQVVAVSEP